LRRDWLIFLVISLTETRSSRHLQNNTRDFEWMISSNRRLIALAEIKSRTVVTVKITVC
jgi:hypothetical protein